VIFLKYLKRIGTLFLWMLPALFLGAFISVLVAQLYEHLSALFPESFPLYNVVLEKEEHEALTRLLDIIALGLTAIVGVFISLKLNNERFEYMISKTDGLYLTRDALPIYSKHFALCDLIASVLIGTAFSVSVSFIPKQFFSTGKTLATILTPLHLTVDAFGMIGASVYFSFMLIIAHFICLPSVLGFYRAKWLSGFAEG
jgi:hypothetical protein